MTCLDLRFMGNQMTRESRKREEAKGRNRREDKRRQTDRSGEGEEGKKGKGATQGLAAKRKRMWTKMCQKNQV